jgi:Tfp pilus assembly protein PilN
MIRVNLLRDQTARVRRSAVKPTVSRTGLLMLLAFLVVAGGLGTWWWSLTTQVEQQRTKRDQLRLDSAKLEGLKKQLDQYEKKKALRQSRIDVIEKLKENQTGPVRLLSHVIESMPAGESVWLTLLDQKGDRVQITGYAVRGESIPGFLSNLSRSGFFKTVDLESMEDDKTAARFSLVCTVARKATAE